MKALHHEGIKIILHCFEYGRGEQQELNKYCEQVYYYPRKKGLSGFSFSIPYIVSSRVNEQLLQNLKKDNHPILLEGIHCSYYLYKDELPGRKVILRLHNVEYQYYRRLNTTSASIIKRLYYWFESRLLKQYEKAIAEKATILSVSEKDTETYRREFNATDIHYIPVFLPYTLATGKTGNGTFCLYQGNLSVAENIKAVEWLVREIFSKSNIPFVIAGKNPPASLKLLADKFESICVCANPSQQEMDDLIAKAHINIIPSFNETGVKIKLLNALFNGRHCLVNQETVEGTSLGAVCEIASDGQSFLEAVERLYKLPFADQQVELRQGLLQRIYNNKLNAEKLIPLIY